MVVVVALDVDRFRDSMERAPWLSRCLFLPHELAYAEGSGDPTHHLALTFAAKRSVLKMLELEPMSDWLGRVSISRDRFGAMSAKVIGGDHGEIGVATCHLEGKVLGMATSSDHF